MVEGDQLWCQRLYFECLVQNIGGINGCGDQSNGIVSDIIFMGEKYCVWGWNQICMTRSTLIISLFFKLL